MAKAPSQQQERKSTHKKPYSSNNGPFTPTASASGSISKLKGSLRSAKRLLQKDGLDAALRVETERRVESLQAELKEAEAKRPPTSKPDDGEKVKANAANHADLAQESKKSKGGSKDKSKKNEKRQNVYKMLRHVEYQKTRRRFKTASKELATIVEQLEALDDSKEAAGKADKKAKKSLEKQRPARGADVLRARIDSWYVATFPADKKYVALFPAGTYIEHPDTLPTISVSDVSNEQDVLELFPPNKKPDEVRTFWRAVVRMRLDQGVLVGEPKEKKKTITDKQQKSGKGDAEAEEPEDEDQAEEASSSSDSSEASDDGASTVSDALRQTPGEKIHDAIKPDAQKTWTEQKGDQIKGTADQFASHAQPQHDKSGTQKVIDAVTPDNQGTSHHHVANNDTRQGPLDKMKAALTPDAQKPATTQAHDHIVGKTDNAIGEATPHENKSFIQKVKDAVNPHSSA